MAVVLVVALVLDGQDADGPRPVASAPASLTAADVALIARRVERLRDLRFRHPVKPLFVGRQRAVRIVEQGSELQYPESRRRGDEEALKLLGLMRPSESLDRALAAVDREQILGFYDNRSKRLVVVRDQQANRPLLEITLAHELVHALEDQHFNQDAHGGPTDDAAVGASALAEGSATAVMIDYATRYLRGQETSALLAATAGAETRLPAYVEDTLLFPYEQGLQFVETFRGDSGSWGALDNVWRFRPPATEEQVIHPDKYAIDERPAPVAIPDLGLVLGGQWSRLDESSVGELDLRELFKIVGGRPDDSAAAGWGGGRFVLWRKGSADCSAPCVSRDVGVMALRWDSAEDRRVAEGALGEAFRKGLHARPAGRAGGAVLWSSRGGTIALAGGGLSTDVVFAPNAALAARVMRTLRG